MNNLDELIRFFKGRRSIRRYSNRPVDRQIIGKLVEAAQWAPSAGNRQDWLFTVITSSDLKARLAAVVHDRWEGLCKENAGSGISEELEIYARNFDWFSRAPVVVTVSCRKPDAYLLSLLGDAAIATSGARVSAAMAVQNFMLAAHAAGLGTCCLTGPLAAQESISALLNLGNRREIVCLMAMGYPAETPSAPPRTTVDRIMVNLE